MPVLFAAIALAWAGPVQAGTFTIDWDQIGWNEAAASPQVFNGVGGSGVDLTVTYTNNMWDGTPNIHDDLPPFLPVDQDGLLRFTNDAVSPLQRTTVSLIFSEPVFVDHTGVLSISILGTIYQEISIVEAFDGQNNLVEATSYGSNNPALVDLDVDGDETYTTPGLGFQDSNQYGDVFLAWEEVPISRIDFSFEISRLGKDDLARRLGSLLIDDTTFTTVPEPATLALVCGGLVGLGLAGRRRS